MKQLVESALHFNAPSPYLDALIAQSIMGFAVKIIRLRGYHFVYQRRPGSLWTSVPRYSSDRKDALDLLKHFIPKYSSTPPGPGSPFYLVNIEGKIGGAKTWPLAVCKAALQAAGLYEPAILLKGE